MISYFQLKKYLKLLLFYLYFKPLEINIIIKLNSNIYKKKNIFRNKTGKNRNYKFY